MNKNTLTGLLLMAALLIGFSWYNQPSKEEVEAHQRQQDSIATAAAAAQKQMLEAEEARREAAEAAAKGDTTALFYAALNGSEEQIELRNGKLALTFSTKGGTLSSARILGFKDRNGAEDVTLFTPADELPHRGQGRQHRHARPILHPLRTD